MTINIGLFFLRVVSSLMLLSHGIAKIGMLASGDASDFLNPIGIGSTFSLIHSIFAEVGCSILVMIGLKPRLFALPIIINMWVAGFLGHIGQPYSSKEAALLYLVIYISIALLGGGKYTIDYYLSRNKNRIKSKKEI